jgi:sortase (surface protein transpeptidase)
MASGTRKPYAAGPENLMSAPAVASQSRRLTLVTCYPFDYIGAAPKLIVQAEMVPDRRQ